MGIIKSLVSSGGEEFQKNTEAYEELVEELRDRMNEARRGGSEKARERHKERGKLPVRDRIDNLLDPDTAFLELSPLAAYGMYDGDVPAAGIVTGIGRVSGREVMVVANDATVKGGTYYPMTVKKHLRAQEIAEQNHLPCIYLVDSGGAFLPLQDEVFPDREHFGRIFYNQARMSAKGIPQIAAVMGSCTAGGAYVPAMSDEVVIVEGEGTIFLGGPPLVKAATGEEVTAEDLGGAEVHTRLSGVADHFAENDEHALATVRQIVANLNREKKDPLDPYRARGTALRHRGTVRPRAARSTPGLRRARGDISGRRRESDARVQAALRRDARMRLRPDHGPPGGHPRQQRHLVLRERPERHALYRDVLLARYPARLLAEHNRLYGRAGVRGGRHRQGRRETRHGRCQRERPEVYRDSRGLLRGRKLRYGWTGLLSALPLDVAERPNQRDGRRTGCERTANRTLTEESLSREGKALTDEEREQFKAPILEKYEEEGNPYHSTARLWDDGVIDPADTRMVLALGLSAAANAPVEDMHFGIFRM